MHVSGFGRSKAIPHLNIHNHFFIIMNRIICLLVFGKISSSFNYVSHPPGHTLDQPHQVQSRASWWPPAFRGCLLWAVFFFFFIQIHRFLSAQIRNSIATFFFSLDQCILAFCRKKRKLAIFSLCRQNWIITLCTNFRYDTWNKLSAQRFATKQS